MSDDAPIAPKPPEHIEHLGAQSFTAPPQPMSRSLAVDKQTSDIIEAVRQMSPDCDAFSITDIKENFLEGKLYSVSFRSFDGKYWFVRVYKVEDKIEVFKNDEMLLSVLGQRYKKTSFNPLSPDLFAGYIAILITIFIGYLVLFRGENVSIPDILSNALTIILGYYFGKSAAKA